jgi:Xaa-Pro dipeptidase
MDSGNKNWLKATRPIGVDGYRSDISRTIFFGEPSQKQKDVWNHMKLAQTAAFEAAQIGVPCEEVDAAARRSLEANGYGPGYETPGFPHRTGHGIGLGGHEGTVHLTKGNKRPLEVGMCFSNEPMIVIPDEFGVRIEDCIHITEAGAKFFSEPQPSYDQAW